MLLETVYIFKNKSLTIQFKLDSAPKKLTDTSEEKL